MSQPIAIVGISAELPSGTYSEHNLDHSSFFDFLLNSGESYENIPSARFNFEAWKGEGLGQINAEKGSFLKDIDLFDHVEFGISSRDARAMAPATRKLIELCFLALLDSGIDYRKENIGCYMSANSISLSNVSNPDAYEPRGSFAGGPSMVANRVSNHLDLLGPSVPVDTACSSSQTALHLAVQGILSGDCKAAVVGGCQINHGLVDWITYSQAKVLSTDGKCKPFDASADGFGRAEGGVVVVIKPLEDALRDRDRIYATILGTSTNSTGSGGPPGAPVAEAQSQAMMVAFDRANRKPVDVDYVELHATGTAKGDPTEVSWVGQHFQRPRELLIGSVKGNIGHTEIAAFLVSLSKVLSIFEHKTIPPNVNLSTPNPAIGWTEYNLHVPTRPTTLPSSASSRALISMSSSGIGGSNGHVVLEAPPEESHPTHRLDDGSHRPFLLLAAGLSPRSAAAIADQISEIVQTARPSEYAAASTVFGRRAKQMSWRSYALAVPGTGPVRFSKPQYSGRDANSLVFVFSGQGPQHESMGRELFSAFPVFRDSILEMDAVFKRDTNKSIVQDYGLFGSAPSSFAFPSIWPISLTLPAIAMFQMAFFDLLIHLGLRPDIVLGHSAGETAVLYASGAAPKALALQLAIIRGRVFSALEASGGTMAALSCSPQEAERLLAIQTSVDAASVVELACINSPSAVAISGQERSIDTVLHLAEQEGIFARKIRTRVPIHSSMMELCCTQYLSEVQALFERYPGPHLPKISTYSTLTGKPFYGPFDAEYFWKNTRSRVLFAPVVQQLSEASTFLEIAPHPVLSSYLSDMALRSSAVVSTMHRPKRGSSSTEYRDVLDLLGKLTSGGHNSVDFTVVNGAICSQSKIKLPSYPFLKQQFPLYPDATKDREYYHGPINRSQLRLNRDTHPTLAEHVIRAEPIWPAAGFLEMALEFGATALFDVNLRSILPLSTDAPLPVNVTLDGSYWRVTSSIQRAKGSETTSIERLHADGYLSFEAPPEYEDLDIAEIRNRCHSYVDSEFYPSLSYFSSYGPKFQRITNIYHNSNEALASVRGIDGSLYRENPYILHPAILDACFQVTGYRPFHGDFAPNNYHLPSRIEELILHQPSKAKYFPSHVYAHVQFSGWTPESMHYNGAVVDDLGRRLCTLKFVLARHQITPLNAISSPMRLVAQSVCHESCMSPPVAHPTDESPQPLLFDEEDAFLFTYTLGREAKLQWNFSGLNPSQELDIWITATEGLDSAAGSALARALRREYLFWNIRFVTFPSAFSEERRRKCLHALPSSMGAESDIIFSPTGDPLVPRLVPLVTVPPKIQAAPVGHALGPNHALASIDRISAYPQFVAVVASVTQVHLAAPEYKPGSRVVGLQRHAMQGCSIIDLASMFVIPSQIPFCSSDVDVLPGIIVSVLAPPGLCMSKRHFRVNTLSILITHCDTAIGSTVSEIYSGDGVKFLRTRQDITILDLARMGYSSFDLIISGYEDKSHVQVLRRLLRPSTGKLFLWHDELSRILREDPSCINDALQIAISRGYHQTCLRVDHPPSHLALNGRIGPENSHLGALFHPEKTYIILGGIGSLGCRIALYMSQRGARHIIVTSLSGPASLRKENNLIVQRIFTYLQGLDSLDIRLEAVDATSLESMGILFDSIGREIGGCFILTAVLAEGLFPTLSEQHFATVLASKTGVLETLLHTADSSMMEFIVAFSSVTSVFGTGGQTSYCAANAALEEQVRKLPNGFSFICPAITDSAIFQANGGQSRYKHLMEWAISTDEMLLWLDDAICKHQNGAGFHTYMPSLDWAALDRTHGMPRLGAHLVTSPQDNGVIRTTSEPVEIKAGRIIRDVLNIAETDFDADVPLTSYGIDSLSAGRLSFALRSIVEVTQLQLLADNSLTDIMLKFPQSSPNPASVEAKQVSDTKGMSSRTLMDDLVRKFTDHINNLGISPMSSEACQMPSSHTVLITGSTGALGCHLLEDLLARDGIHHVYALNRPSPDGVPLLDRQLAGFQRQGLSSALAHSTKLTLLTGDLERDDLGIPSEMMHELLSSITYIIHNAWTINLIARLSEFEDQVLGTTRLLEFAMRSKRLVRPSFSFISTIGVCRNLPSGVALAPESTIEDARIAVQSGYGESKWVAERVVQMASKQRYLNTNVIRVGLLTGSASGSWDTSHWVPALVQSGVHVGCLPDGNDVISWLPISLAAAAIVDMQSTMNETLHLVHPRPATWRAVMEPSAAMLGIPLVPYAEWFARLKATAEFTPRAAGGAGAIALKLIDLFQLGVKPAANRESMGLLPRVASHKGIQASPTLLNEKLPSLGSADVEKWIQYWRKHGFLTPAKTS